MGGRGNPQNSYRGEGIAEIGESMAEIGEPGSIAPESFGPENNFVFL